jgi:hypothetical protein
VSSDCLFAALSLIWFTLLLWIIHKPSEQIIIWHSIVLFIAFTIRYNAIIYPLIALIAFFISELPLRKKITGCFAGVLLCGIFVFFTSYQYKKLTGYWQFSPFTGWLMTNNAMYAYRYVNSAQRKPVPIKFLAFDNMVRQYFDSTRNTKKFPAEAMQASTVYMWSRALPMFKYRDSLFRKDTIKTIGNEFKKWAGMGPFYKQYGLNIIKLYPWYFIKYFIWPNAKKYYALPIEFLESYNSGRHNVSEETKVWFGYKTTNVKTRTKDNIAWILSFYPILSGIINLTALCLLIFYLILKGWNYEILFKKMVILGGSIWLINACFTICISSAALRFQSFPLILTTLLVVILVDWMFKSMINMKMIDGKQKENLTTEAFA